MDDQKTGAQIRVIVRRVVNVSRSRDGKLSGRKFSKHRAIIVQAGPIPEGAPAC